MPATPIFRAPMRARDHDAPPGVGADFGVDHGVVGIGDVLERRIERLRDLPDGTFVWTRTSDGRYRLGRIAGPLRRLDASDAAGITWVRDTTWLERPFGEDEVPVAVAATFARGGRNLQRTHDDAAEERTLLLWETHANG